MLLQKEEKGKFAFYSGWCLIIFTAKFVRLQQACFGIIFGEG